MSISFGCLINYNSLLLKLANTCFLRVGDAIVVVYLKNFYSYDFLSAISLDCISNS